MDKNRLHLEGHLENYETQLKSLNSYIKELNDRTAQYGTDRSQFETDLLEAEQNVKFYEGAVEHIKQELKELDKQNGAKDETATVSPDLIKQGIGALILSAVSFVAGAILGSKLGGKDPREEK
jgi:chromosome segregation ATPase